MKYFLFPKRCSLVLKLDRTPVIKAASIDFDFFITDIEAVRKSGKLQLGSQLPICISYSRLYGSIKKLLDLEKTGPRDGISTARITAEMLLKQLNIIKKSI